MKIIVIGAGEIGFHLTKKLSNEHDITLIENDRQRVIRASEQLDAFVIEGNGASYRVLKEAKFENADAVAAVTDNDELNLMICQIAAKAGIPEKIARVRNHEYTQPNFIIPDTELGPDYIIHPERETAEAVTRLLRQSIATDIIEFADGKIELMGVRLEDQSPLLRVPLKDLGREFQDLPLRIVAIHRKNRTLIPRGDDILARGDQIFIMCDPAYMKEIVRLTGKTKNEINNVMILGGGLIGQFIAVELHDQMNVKIVESSAEKSQIIADKLSNCLVIHGDGTDIDLLAVEGLIDMDAFIAVTGNDETNIISTLMARHLKVPRTIALVNKTEYMPITPTIGMDAVVSKQLLTVNAVQRYIHHKEVASIATLPGVDAQVIEFCATDSSKICRKPLKDINFPHHAIIGAVIDQQEAIIPKGDTQIRPGNKIVVFTLPDALKKVEKFF